VFYPQPHSETNFYTILDVKISHLEHTIKQELGKTLQGTLVYMESKLLDDLKIIYDVNI